MTRSALSQLGQRTADPPISWLMHLTLAHPHLISLAAGFTDNESLPVTETRALLERALVAGPIGQKALQYGPTLGDLRLRELTADRLRALDGAPIAADGYSAKHTLISNGSQQALYLLTEALCDPGDIVLVEDPTYFVYLSIAQSHGLRCRGIRLDQDGLDLQCLEETLESLRRDGELPRVKMLYLVSYYQNPTGVTTSFAKKAGALKLLKKYEKAAGHPLYLLEDAAYRELRFQGPDTHSALAVKGFANRVLYTGTYSKPFATGARVGFALLPEPVFTVVARLKGNHDFGTSNLVQQLLRHALEAGRYAHHLEAFQRRYHEKSAVMVAAVRRHFPKSVAWQEPNGGLYVWAKLPGRLKSGPKSKVFKLALAHDILYVPGWLCYADDPARPKPDSELRISFGGATLDNIKTGIARLGEVLNGLIRP